MSQLGQTLSDLTLRYYRGDYGTAQLILENALAESPNEALLLGWHGRLLLQEGRLSEARSALEACTRGRIRHNLFSRVLAEACAIEGDYLAEERARLWVLLNQGDRADPQDWLALALCYARQERLQEALQLAEGTQAGNDQEASEKRERLIRFLQYRLAGHDYFIGKYGEHRFCVPITGRTYALESRLISARIAYEIHANVLEAAIEPGTHCLEIGANALSTAFLAIACERVYPVEYRTHAIDALKATVAKDNSLPIHLDLLGPAPVAPPTQLRSDIADLCAPPMVGPGETAPSKPLDEIVPAGLQPDLLVVDLLGLEREVLLGANELLARWRPRIVIKVLDNKLSGLERILSKLNYRIARGDFDGDLSWRSLLLLPC